MPCCRGLGQRAPRFCALALALKQAAELEMRSSRRSSHANSALLWKTSTVALVMGASTVWRISPDGSE